MPDHDHVKQLLRRWRSLKGDRATWDSHWDDLARVMLPRRLGFVTSTTPGEKRVDDLYDGTAMQAARGLANALGTMMRDGQFFFLRGGEDADEHTDEAKDWMADSELRIREALESPRSRFRQATGEADLDMVVFGTAVLFEAEGRSLDHLLFQSVHLKDACVFFNDEGEAEGIFRSRSYPLREIGRLFKPASLSTQTQKMLRDAKDADLDKKIAFLHAVVPRADGRADAMLARNLPWAGMWIEVEAQHLVKSEGFHEFPFIVPRWDTSSGESYGRSPGMIALPDANTSQAIGETMLVAGQRAADPPLGAPADGAFHEINTFPGGISYYDVETAAQVRGNPFFPIENGANMPLTRDMQRDTRDQIWNAFFKNVLRLPTDGPQMTATEINQRREEFIRETGSVFGRLESDYTAPMIERAFRIMLRAGAFLPIPESLQGSAIRFEYQSPLTKMRQQMESAAAQEWVQSQVQLSQAKPEALDLINADEFGRFTAEAAGIPHGIINGADAVAALRAERAEDKAEAKQSAQVDQTASLVERGVNTAARAGDIGDLGDISGLMQAIGGGAAA